MPRKCLAIGVSSAPGLAYLGGAINAARDIHHWATCSGYESILMIDEDDVATAPTDVRKGPVTVDTMAAALEDLLPHGSATDRLVVFFAGHGLIQELGESLWVLNDWQDYRRVVSVKMLRRALTRYGVAQISIMSDACSEIASTATLLGLERRGVLSGGYTTGDDSVPTDSFIAALDGRATYMLPGPTPEEDRCIFSGVLLEGLWGHNASAFSKLAPDLVVSASLAPFLKARAAEIGGSYKLTVKPDPQPGLYEPDNVYFDKTRLPNGSYQPRPWPDPAIGIDALGRATAQAIGTKETQSAKLESVLGGLLGSTTMIGSIGSAIEERGLGDILSSIDPEMSAPFDTSDAVSDSIAVAGDNASQIADAVLESEHPLSEQDRREVEWLADRGRLQAAAQTTADDAQMREDNIRKLVEDAAVPSHNIAGHPGKLTDGLVVAGRFVRAIWAESETNVVLYASGQAWQLTGLPFGESRQLLVEFKDGSFAPCVVMSGLTTRLIATEDGVGSVIYEPEYTQYEAIQRSIALTIDTTARLYAGTLASGAAVDLAVDLRMLKHFNPVLGVLSAHLYDAIGDTDSIQRMAYYYAAHHQHVPYDIAYLANLPTERDESGRLIVKVKRLKARKPRTDLEKKHDWTFKGTKAATTRVAGLVPWMRQGWDYLIAPSDAEAMMAHGLAAFGTALLPSPFTALAPTAGHALAAALKMEVRT